MEWELIFFFHKVSSQDENLQYGCTFIKFSLDKNTSTLSPLFLKKHELHISAEDTKNNQLAELRYRSGNVLCYSTELETDRIWSKPGAQIPQLFPWYQSIFSKLKQLLSLFYITHMKILYILGSWGNPEEHFIFKTCIEILEFLPQIILAWTSACLTTKVAI